jgi:hypothetical protein
MRRARAGGRSIRAHTPAGARPPARLRSRGHAGIADVGVDVLRRPAQRQLAKRQQVAAPEEVPHGLGSTVG